MKLIKRNPIEALFTPRKSFLENFFDDDLDKFFLDNSFSPSLDVYEKDGSLHIIAEVPGMSEKDVTIEVRDDVLTISGEKKNEREEKKNGYYFSERNFGSFCRSFRIPNGTDTDKIKAEFKKGILSIEVPESETQKAKKIKINE